MPWQDKYEPNFECPCCHDIVEEKDYNWLVSMCKQCIEGHTQEQEQKKEIEILREKAEKYDELQRLWWWLERRTHNGETANVNIRSFLKGAKEHFEPYKE